MGTLPEGIRTDFNEPLDEWVYWARELMAYQPEATFWDLLCLMFYIKTGRMFSDKVLEDG